MTPARSPMRFAQDQLAVVMNIRLDVVAVELVHHALGLRLEFLQVVSRPPIVQTAHGIVLRTLIVEAMADLVPDDHPNGAIVDRIGCLHAEGRRLQDSSRKDNFVQQRIVVGVGGRWRHAPAAAIDRLADGRAIVAHEELRAAMTSSKYKVRVMTTWL